MRSLIKQIEALIEQHQSKQASEISTLKTKVRRLTRQRDEAAGRASEYRSYATKYQKELASLKKSSSAGLHND